MGQGRPLRWITEAKEESLQRSEARSRKTSPRSACPTYSEATASTHHPLAFAGIGILGKDAAGIANAVPITSHIYPKR